MIGGASLQASFPAAFTNGSAPLTIALGSHFADTAINGPFVDMDTTLGHMYFQLDSGREPVPSTNFLAYVNAGRYDGTVFDRSVAGRPDTTQFGPTTDDSFVQGGGFTTSGTSVTTNADLPINDTWQIEDSNGAGFIGMARVGNDPNSAKSEFFINELDNSTLFDGKSSTNPTGDPQGGYSVFGQLAFKTISNATLNSIAAIATPNSNNVAAPLFPQVPGSVDPTGLASVITARQTLPLTFSATTNNPAVTATIGGTGLNPTVILSYAPGTTGTVNITVTATALDNSSTATGTFALTFDTVPPTASLSAAVAPPQFHDPGVDINVTFADNDSFDATTLGDGDVVVTDPNGVAHAATFVSASSGTTSVQATFHYGGRADIPFRDNGTYLSHRRRRCRRFSREPQRRHFAWKFPDQHRRRRADRAGGADRLGAGRFIDRAVPRDVYRCDGGRCVDLERSSADRDRSEFADLHRDAGDAAGGGWIGGDCDCTRLTSGIT